MWMKFWQSFKVGMGVHGGPFWVHLWPSTFLGVYSPT